jgi:opacity protein-like surface antigen
MIDRRSCRRSNHPYFDPFLPFGPFFGSDSVNRTGYTVGGGVEYAINNNSSAKIEYLYLNFGTSTFASPATLSPHRSLGPPTFGRATTLCASG